MVDFVPMILRHIIFDCRLNIAYLGFIEGMKLHCSCTLTSHKHLAGSFKVHRFLVGGQVNSQSMRHTYETNLPVGKRYYLFVVLVTTFANTLG